MAILEAYRIKITSVGYYFTGVVDGSIPNRSRYLAIRGVYDEHSLAPPEITFTEVKEIASLFTSKKQAIQFMQKYLKSRHVVGTSYEIEELFVESNEETIKKRVYRFRTDLLDE